ncbi:flavin-containing monooxygenase [Sphingomonas bacterium]|uniref:flavin-containing monooxygenase n=1 Tax=Sphingomonas bacterium TaxID=1895847 RepID=UPI0015760FC4|nr:NAD(P)/FAD-dependent oxidoreductase [Sphingomonas bacterium]
MAEHIDVLMVGAGISGVAQAYHLQTRCPDRRYAILEARQALGGTWDLFRYPGIRSDSDMHTLGFAFHPWSSAKAIADGASIRAYVEEVARAHGIDQHIRFGIKVTAASWSSETARWTVDATGPEGPVQFTCDFLCMCSGYYAYAKGHSPEFTGAEDFTGLIVHPQTWPEDLDYRGKRVVVIGSGATAMTLIPALARDAIQVTMLQRSPTYVVSVPAEDAIANWLRGKLPARLAHGLTRWKNILLGMYFFHLARRKPEATRQRLLGMLKDHLAPDYDIATHFTPRYKVWDQRVCLVPDADLFAAIRAGRADMVTDTIDRFVPEGIRLSSGRTLPADLVVTATGLDLLLLGGVSFQVDGEPVNFAGKLQYKGMMFADVPNLAFLFGYTNASWTLKAELVAKYVARLLNTMRKRGQAIATPRNDDPSVTPEPFTTFTSGYIQRAQGQLPMQGSKKPWRLHQNYALDVMALRFGSIDAAMCFSNPGQDKKAAA